jgi:lysophospholipase L1-like esterase
MPASAGAAQPGLPAGVPPAAAAAFRRFPPAPIYGSSDMTLREIVHVSLGGSRIRIVFTNEFGTEPLMIGPASVALSKGGHTVNTADASSVPLTFGGRESVSIPAGALMVSDPVSLTLPAQSDLAVSFFVPQQTITTLSQHGSADQTSYVADGNVVGAASFDSAKEIRSWVFVKNVDVEAPAHASVVVAFGDSITDGAFATNNANARWPDELARRLQADKRTANVAVLNEGIGGNGVLRHITGPSALTRFDRDVLAQPGVKYMIILEAINDIGAYGRRNPNSPAAAGPPPVPPTAEDLIGGYRQMIERAHMHGIKVYMATLTPYMGANYAAPAGEAVRTAVNQWIRTNKIADGFIDFDKATQDPAHPDTILPAYDHGDHLHPGDAGYKAMGDAIDLALFTK